MAQRPIFLPEYVSGLLWREVVISFDWYPGFAISQAQKSIRSLHEAAARQRITPVLEISTKSPQEIGIQLSAFNLRLNDDKFDNLSVESAYQGSKVFERGGPYHDLYTTASREAKKDKRLQNSGKLVAFNFKGTEWPLIPQTAFYDWLYISALVENAGLHEQIMNYRAFSDIAFNPEKSLNCQARSVALFVSLHKRKLLDVGMFSQGAFIGILLNHTNKHLDKS